MSLKELATTEHDGQAARGQRCRQVEEKETADFEWNRITKGKSVYNLFKDFPVVQVGGPWPTCGTTSFTKMDVAALESVGK